MIAGVIINVRNKRIVLTVNSCRRNKEKVLICHLVCVFVTWQFFIVVII